VYSKIPEEWLDKALERLDDKVTALYARFDVIANYRNAEERKLDALVKPRDVEASGPLRKSYMEKYAGNKDRYGRRKLGGETFWKCKEALSKVLLPEG
ncbi:MAG: hypothetical protein N2V78_13080, partial [Methanophagales archaeon]|nr:hypothetical protein [Methanophagales archaeon]